MGKKTLKALKGSIEKWERIVREEGKDWGAINCPLCNIFYCEECIIGKKIDTLGCVNTPYEEWVKHQNKKHTNELPFEINCFRCKKLAQAELNFLKSLLPKGGK